MAARIGDRAVYVIDAGGHTHWLMPGDVVPVWAAGQVGQHVLAGGAVSAVPTPSQEIPATDTGQPVEVPAPAHSGGDSPPPQAGAGSSRDHWASYAQAQGIDVGADWKRDRIIEACRQGGVRVE